MRFDDSLLCFVHIDVCSGGWEYRYQKPFATATFLVCVDQTVSGLEMDMSPVECFVVFLFHLAGQEGNIMILERNDVVTSVSVTRKL